MGRQWLHAKRAIVNLKKGQAVGKLVKEITVAAKLGGGDPAANARLFAAVEKARKASVTREVIERAIRKGAGGGDDKSSLEHVVFEGYAPHKVPLIVEVYTDNNQRTAPEMRVLFKKGVLGGACELEIVMRALEGETLAERTARARSERVAAAEQTLMADPGLQSLTREFGARVVPGSLQVD